MKVKNDPRSEFSNLSNWKEEAWKKIRASTGFEPLDLRNTGAMPYQLSYEATHWERGQFVEFISSRQEWNDVSIYEIIHILNWKIHCEDHSSLSSMTAVQIYELFHIYLHHFTPDGKIWTQQIDLAPNVWLHSSVGRASHRYRGGHGFESRWSPDFFQASSFQLLKLENSLRGSFFTYNIRNIAPLSEKNGITLWPVV